MLPDEIAATVARHAAVRADRNFELSKRFYADIGFRGDAARRTVSPNCGWPTDTFLLQDYFVQQWAENFVMHMMVDDVDEWWAYIASLDLAGRYAACRDHARAAPGKLGPQRSPTCSIRPASCGTSRRIRRGR